MKETFKIEDALPILQNILDTNHNTAQKKKIKKSTKSYQCACPICGDSDKDNSAKRGHLYFKNLFYRCYNCDFRGSFLSLMKHFDIQIDIQLKMDMIDYVDTVMDTISFDEEEFLNNALDKLMDMDDLIHYFNTNENSEITNFRPVTKGSVVYNYLVNERKIYNHDNLYEGTFWYTKTWYDNVLINVNYNKSNGKVLGIQTRNLKEDKNQRRFKVFNFTELYNKINDVELDEIEAIGYNKLSYLYNILNINWEKPITVFEGYLDSKFFPNSIGCVGTNTDLDMLLAQDANIRVFFDNDETGIRKTIEMLYKGYSVFLWNKFLKEWSSKYKNPNKMYRKLKKHITDLNNVGKLQKNPYKELELEKFFSYDEFDLMYITDD